MKGWGGGPLPEDIMKRGLTLWLGGFLGYLEEFYLSGRPGL